MIHTIDIDQLRDDRSRSCPQVVVLGGIPLRNMLYHISNLQLRAFGTNPPYKNPIIPIASREATMTTKQHMGVSL